MYLSRTVQINEFLLHVYGTADPKNQKNAELFFCSSLRDFRSLKTVPEHIRIPLETQARRDKFPESSPFPMVKIQGGAAFRISVVLTQYFNAGAPIKDATKCVSGYWLPPIPVPHFGAIVCWQGELSDHRVAIAFSQLQALEVLQDLRSWLDVNEHTVMMINTLNSVLPERSSREKQIFGGLAAGLIHQAALYQSAWEESQHVPRH